MKEETGAERHERLFGALERKADQLWRERGPSPPDPPTAPSPELAELKRSTEWAEARRLLHAEACAESAAYRRRLAKEWHDEKLRRDARQEKRAEVADRKRVADSTPQPRRRGGWLYQRRDAELEPVGPSRGDLRREFEHLLRTR